MFLSSGGHGPIEIAGRLSLPASLSTLPGQSYQHTENSSTQSSQSSQSSQCYFLGNSFTYPLLINNCVLCELCVKTAPCVPSRKTRAGTRDVRASGRRLWMYIFFIQPEARLQSELPLYNRQAPGPRPRSCRRSSRPASGRCAGRGPCRGPWYRRAGTA